MVALTDVKRAPGSRTERGVVRSRQVVHPSTAFCKERNSRRLRPRNNVRR